MNKNTRAYWDKRLSEMGSFWREEPYQVLLPLLPDRFSLLDVGCAMGDGCELIKRTFPQADVRGCDISPTGIRKAKAKDSEVDYFTLDIAKGDVPGIYDYITIIETLEHLDNPFGVVEKCLGRVRDAVFISVPYNQSGLPSPLEQEESDARGEHLWSFDENTLDGPVLIDVVNEGTMPRILYRLNVDRIYSALDSPVEVPVQVAAYELARDKYIEPGDSVLDVGFGLGYGMDIMAEKASISGIEVDEEAVRHAAPLVGDAVTSVRWYDGEHIPYDDDSFDVVTCVDVLEHVRYYEVFLAEMARVARRVVFISTPNWRPEHANPDGTPRNRWHLREWTFDQLGTILQKVPGARTDWNVLDGRWRGPFSVSSEASKDTMALSPGLLVT